VVSLEDSLTKIEDEASPILSRIVGARALRDIAAEERQAVASFCAVQVVRTQGFREENRWRD